MRRSLIHWMNRRVLNPLGGELISARCARPTIEIDYPPDPVPRYGHGKPAHDLLYRLIDRGRSGYADLMKGFAEFQSGLGTIPEDAPRDRAMPYWQNQFIGGTNAVALYCLPAIYDSRRYVEIGSGNSTKFLRRSVTDNRLRTRITSIDPTPRSDIDGLCDEVLRTPLENTDLALFADLGQGDILFFDGSHRCFQNSDVTVFFLEILPSLKPGVIIYIDDVYLPYDYPPDWSGRWYSEQYLLATLLLADQGRHYAILFPHVFVEHDDELAAAERLLWRAIGREGRSGNGFWLRKT